MADASPENIHKLQMVAQDTLEAALQEDEHQYGLNTFIRMLIDNSPAEHSA